MGHRTAILVSLIIISSLHKFILILLIIRIDVFRYILAVWLKPQIYWVILLVCDINSSLLSLGPSLNCILHVD